MFFRFLLNTFLIDSELYGFDIVELGLDQNGIPTSFTTSDGTVINLLNEVVITQDHPDPETTDNGNPDDPCPSGDCNGSDNGSPDDPCPSGDYNDCYGNGGGGGSGGGGTTTPTNIEITWYLDFDEDGYHGSTYEAVVSPGDKWKTTTSGVDCDDARPQYTTVCCTKTCESGYKLNIDTCECVLLPPCFGSPNYNTNTVNSALVDEIGSILDGLGLGGDTKMAVIKLASGDLTEISGYINNLDILSKEIALGSVAISLTNYYNDPSTQNLLQVLFDSGAAVVAFSSGPAAPFVSLGASFANATGATSYVLENLANLIDRSVDCNVGQGIRNKIP